MAFELDRDASSNEGYMLLCVNGQSFGKTQFSYDVVVALKLLDEVIEDADYYAPELLALGVDEFVQLVNCMYDDCVDPQFTTFAHYFGKLDADLIVRHGYYAFDRCLIGIVADEIDERIFVMDIDDGRKESRILPVGTFHGLVKQARAEWESASPN